MDINGVNNENAQPIEQQHLVHGASQESIDRSEPTEAYNTNVSAEAAKVQNLIDRVQEMDDVRADAVSRAVENLRQGNYNSPEVLSITTEKLLEEI